MQIEFREARPSELDQVEALWTVVYRDGVSQVDPKPLPSYTRSFVGLTGGKPVFACQVDDYSVMRGSVGPFRCAGVAMVGVLPEVRHHGVGSRCMVELLSLLRKEGYALSALYGFRDGFYRKFGYATCGFRWQLKCRPDLLPKFKIELEPTIIDPADVQRIGPCYDRFVRTMSGSSLRNPEHWQRRLGQRPGRIYAFQDSTQSDGQIEAYFWCHSDGFWGNLDIGEFAWTTPRGYRSALTVLRSLGINQSSIQWSEPPDSPFVASFVDFGVDVTRHRPTMFRLLNTKSALEGMPVQDAGYRLEVSDSILPENEGVWDVGRRGVSAGSDPTLRCDARTLAQAFMGSPNVSALASHGLISELSGPGTSSLQSMEAHLPSQQVCLMEFF